MSHAQGQEVRWDWLLMELNSQLPLVLSQSRACGKTSSQTCSQMSIFPPGQDAEAMMGVVGPSLQPAPPS